MDSERKTCRVLANLHPKCQDGHYQEQVFFKEKVILLTFFEIGPKFILTLAKRLTFSSRCEKFFSGLTTWDSTGRDAFFGGTFFSENIPISLTFLDSEWRIWTFLDSERKICSFLAKFLLQVCRGSILCLRTNTFRETCSKKYFFSKISEFERAFLFVWAKISHQAWQLCVLRVRRAIWKRNIVLRK